MSNSANFDLTFLEAGQSHKHVSVNNALARIDALGQLVLISDDRNDAPEKPEEGDCVYIPMGEGQFAGVNGKIAIYQNGGFEFVAPKAGWQAYITRRAEFCVFDGVEWQAWPKRETSLAISVLSKERRIENSPQEVMAIPERSIVFGVSALVSEDIKGEGVSGWSLGVGESKDRYGSGLWLGKGGWVKGLTGQPMTYWSETKLLISPEGGEFTGGKVKVKLFYLDLPIPD